MSQQSQDLPQPHSPVLSVSPSDSLSAESVQIESCHSFSAVISCSNPIYHHLSNGLHWHIYIHTLPYHPITILQRLLRLQKRGAWIILQKNIREDRTANL